MNTFSRIVSCILLFGMIMLGCVSCKQHPCDTSRSITSPDGQLMAEVDWSQDGTPIRWRVLRGETVVVDWSALQMNVVYGAAQADSLHPVVSLGQYPSLVCTDSSRVVRDMPQPTYVKRNTVHDEYTRLLLRSSDNKYYLEWRVYNDGVAYRWMLPQAEDVYVMDETVEYRFTGDYQAFLPYENDRRGGHSMCFSFESFYDCHSLSEMYADSLCITPLCVTLPDGLRVIPAETGIRHYPGMFLKKGEGNSLRATFPKVPTAYEIGGFTDLNLVPTERAEYIAHPVADNTEKDALFALPWRTVGVFTSDADILNSDLMQCLAQADVCSQEKMPERGIYCGQSVWDWWNDWGLTGVDFQPGINQPTYEYYARYAAKMGITYMIVDDGWSDHGDLRKTIGQLDIPALINYAKELGVKVILWSSYRALKDDTEATMDYYAQMGVAGFKIDFFDRNDQVITDDVWRLAAIAQKHNLLMDLHGYTPSGIQAVYPNVLSFEGVKGLENFKWEKMVGNRTEHDHPFNVVTAPFLRGFVGPYDYTPGSMRNATYEEYTAEGLHTIGTRANQLAMYIVMEAPLQMLADSPTEYESNPEAAAFITAVPTIFDETIVLDAKMGEYIVLARKNGEHWYVGALTKDERTISLPLSFLGEGQHKAQIVSDGPQANTVARDAAYTTESVDGSQTLTLRLANAGGWAAIIE